LVIPLKFAYVSNKLFLIQAISPFKHQNQCILISQFFLTRVVFVVNDIRGLIAVAIVASFLTDELNHNV